MRRFKDETKLLLYTFLLCIAGFLNLAILKDPFDKGAITMAIIICVLIGYSYFVIRKFFPKGDKYIFVYSSILAVIGLIMLYRINTSDAIKQIIWFAIGVISFIFIVVLLPNLRRFSDYKYIYMGATVVLMSLGTLFGKEVFGAKNWISIGGFSFQPSEFGKLFLVAYLASALKDYENFKDLIQPAAIVAISLGFMVLQRDLGSALIFFGISVTMLYIATSKVKYVITCLGLFTGGGYISYLLFSHVRLRVLIWQNPWPYATDKSYQVVQSMLAIATGGLTGVGLGNGHPEYIPVNTTDFIFSVICEELGILTGFALILLNFLLFYRCMRAALYAEDKFSQLLTVGLSSMMACQALVIVGGVINAIPLTGITLPLVSYGGSSMLSTFFALGIIQKVSEEGRY
ncbi:MAG: FtsW/RodA/SpoVE family cell cycle protein [Clostridiaceae bacterium]